MGTKLYDTPEQAAKHGYMTVQVGGGAIWNLTPEQYKQKIQVGNRKSTWRVITTKTQLDQIYRQREIETSRIKNNNKSELKTFRPVNTNNKKQTNKIQATPKAAMILNAINHPDARFFSTYQRQQRTSTSNIINKDQIKTGKAKTLIDIETGKLSSSSGFYSFGGDIATGKAAKILSLDREIQRTKQEQQQAIELNKIRSSGGSFKPIGTQIETTTYKEVSQPKTTEGFNLTSFEKAVYKQEARQEKLYENLKPYFESNKYWANKITLGGGKDVDSRGFVGRIVEKGVSGVLNSALVIPTYPTMALEKMYLVGRGFVANTKESAKEVFYRAPKETYKQTFKLTKIDSETGAKKINEQAVLTYTFAGIGAGIGAYASFKHSAIKTPNTMTGKTSTSYKYISKRSHTPPGMSKTGKSGSVKTSNLLKRDSHTFTEHNINTGKTAVSVFRGTGGKGKTSIVQVSIGKKAYTTLSKGSKVTVIKQSLGKAKIQNTLKTSIFTKKGVKTFRPIYKTTKNPDFNTRTSIDKVSSSKEYFNVKNMIKEGRVDTFNIKSKSIAKTGNNKISVNDRLIVSNKQIAQIKASQNFKSSGVKSVTTKQGKIISKTSRSLNSKGSYPNLEFGKLQPPIDKTVIKNSKFMVDLNKGTVSGVYKIDYFKGSRVFKDTYYSSKTMGYRQVSVKPIKSVGGMFKDKTANIQTIQKLNTITVGSRLTPLTPKITPKTTFFNTYGLSSIKTPLSVINPLSLASVSLSNKRITSLTKQRTTPISKVVPITKITPISKVTPISKITPITITRSTPKIKTSQLSRVSPLNKIVSSTTVGTIGGNIVTTNITSIPPSLPGSPIPPIVPPPIFFPTLGGHITKSRSRKGRRITNYTPSLTAVTFNIRGSKPNVLSGLEFRPIVSKKKKKKRKK